MLSVRLTPAADADLNGIFAYTLERYGSSQAKRYGGGFLEVFDMLAKYPLIGSPVPVWKCLAFA